MRFCSKCGKRVSPAEEHSNDANSKAESVEATATDNTSRNRIAIIIAIVSLVAVITLLIFFGIKNGDNNATKEIQNAQIGDYIVFGSYEQNNNISDGPEDIEWRVIDKNDDQLLIISKYILDGKPYNTEEVDVTWETCTLRDWLNNDFYSTAFDETEKNMIIVTTNHNPDAREFDNHWDGKGGNDTYDKVFLLNCSEVDDYLNNRQCMLTDYASESILDAVILHYYKEEYGEDWIEEKEKETGKDLRSYVIDDWQYYGAGGDSYFWWLRSPGYDQKSGTDITVQGDQICSLGIKNYHIGVRPVMWISNYSMGKQE